MEVVSLMLKSRQEMLSTNINNNGTCEKSNFSTDAQHPRKLGSPSAFVPLERGVMRYPLSPFHFQHVCDLYESVEDFKIWQAERKIKTLMRIA
jgi:hypothetical protein